MAKTEIINERLSNNMSYLDNQISKIYTQFQDKYSELKSKAEPYDKDGNPVIEMIPGQFTINCPESEINKLTLNAKNDINYMSQCVDELEKIIDESPKNVEYTDEEINSFLSKVIKINNKELRSKQMSLANTLSLNMVSKASRDNNSDLPKRIVEYARKLIGVPYVWGGYDPNKHGGVDCSGLVVYCANQCGYSMNRETTSTLIKMGTEVSRDELQIGDLIFPKSSHVGFYSGNGKFLHAPKPGDKVKEVDIYAFWRARRIFPGVGGDSSSSSSGSSASNGDYYGPGESTELIERTEDPEVTKVIVPQGSTSWSTMASYLGVSVNSLKKMNPGITKLYAGASIYIPTSAITQARQLASKAKNSVAASSRMLDETVSLYSDNIVLTRASTSTASVASSRSTDVVEKTPFQTILNNEDYIKTYDLKEYDYNEKARLEIRYDGKVRTIQTLIAPIGYNETYSNSINVEKTAGGWFVSRHGENLPQLNISGYLLDTKYAPEKHAFMNEFKKYMTDTRNSTTGEYENNAIIKVVMEGVEYQGHVTSVSFNKDANRPSVYTFNLSFTCMYYKNIRDVESAINSLTSKSSKTSRTSLYLADGIASIINNS